MNHEPKLRHRFTLTCSPNFGFVLFQYSLNCFAITSGALGSKPQMEPTVTASISILRDLRATELQASQGVIFTALGALTVRSISFVSIVPA